jgi:hypothetical protein
MHTYIQANDMTFTTSQSAAFQASQRPPPHSMPVPNMMRPPVRASRESLPSQGFPSRESLPGQGFPSRELLPGQGFIDKRPPPLVKGLDLSFLGSNTSQSQQKVCVPSPSPTYVHPQVMSRQKYVFCHNLTTHSMCMHTQYVYSTHSMCVFTHSMCICTHSMCVCTHSRCVHTHVCNPA